jgi:putative copper resistance protein D
VPPLYWTAVTVHLLAALLWLGGAFFLGVVGAPVLRAVEPATLRQRLFHDLGVRFRIVGWLAILVLVATGLLAMHYRGWLVWTGVLDSRTFWRAPQGTALAWKLGAVSTMLVVQFVHDFIHGPAAGKAEADSAHGARLRRRAAWLARVNALLGVGLVIAAVRLARGG